MSNLRVQTIDWPLREFPNRGKNSGDEDVEEESAEQTGLKSVADSLVILQSLRQSRDRWLYSTFPKFSSRSRGNKPAEVVPPPHTIHNRGRCDIEIGPHIFPSTIVFEVHYQYIPPPANASPYVYQPPIPHTAPWQATTAYSTKAHPPHGNRPGAEQAAQTPNPIAASVEAVVSQQTSSPLSSLGAEVTITPGLITQVNMAAASNPTLANLLQMAASGQATADQLKTLSLLIQSLACISGNDASHAPSKAAPAFGFESTQPDGAHKSSTLASAYNAPGTSSNYPAYRSFKEFDIVLEFSENPSDRWILPRSPTIIEHDHESKTNDLFLTLGVPFGKGPLQGGHITNSGADITQHLVTFRLSRASDDIKACLSRWNGGRQSTEIALKALNATLSQAPNKVYLAHQLQAGPQLTQLEIAALPPYVLKSIRPTQGDPIKPRRMRKPAVRKATVISADAPVVSLQTQAATSIPSENTVLAQSLEQSLPAAGPSSQAPLPQASAPKQRKQSKAQSTLPKMACGSCGQTDVPLVRGGRFCRPCAGTEQVIPGVPANGGTFLHKFWAVSTPEQMQAQSVSAAQSRQQTPAMSKRKVADSRNRSTAGISNHSPDEQASSSTVTKKRKPSRDTIIPIIMK